MLQRVESRKKSPNRTATFSVKSKSNIKNLARDLNKQNDNMKARLEVIKAVNEDSRPTSGKLSSSGSE
jgi:hypothetical protein